MNAVAQAALLLLIGGAVGVSIGMLATLYKVGSFLFDVTKRR